ncbi:GTP cyclohydrolase II RibA [Methylocystis sp. JR02]|uniref:GTP cyclohydrolase II RibA n=1 Tax=Methylocystis sp. JR02 TaxID=3046284 RepID=UPI0024BA4619|nr:GTP cyclohydrolase II RibA [Methylocystis sp. JR02]MDJ0447245.1 GTP cyclohydrolase II RibA [Methylocystis sp. JR02]
MVEKFSGEATADVEVERAIAEVRAGRPVLLSEDSRCALVLSVEALDAGEIEPFKQVSSGAAHLALTPTRLRRLGADRQSAGFITLPSIDVKRIMTLAADAQARLDAPVAVAPSLYESALQLLRLAHVLPAALIVPIEDQTPPGLLTARAANVNAFRGERNGRLRIVNRAPVPLEGAPDSEFVVFRGGEGLRDQVAIVIGQPNIREPVTVRLHSACLTGDLFGSLKCDCGDQLRRAARHMAENGGGVLLYLDQEGRGNGLANKIHAYSLQSRGFDTFDADEILGFEEDGRTFGFAGEMLKLLGVTQICVMTNNPTKLSALEAAGLVLVSDHRIVGRKNNHNIRYLATKRDRAGHLLD